MPGLSVALQGDITNPLFGPPGFVTSTTPTVLADGRPVATIGSPVSVHGNPFNPKAPGFNPPCAAAVVATGVSNILVEGRPIATLTSLCTCGLHFVQLVGSPTVQVGPA
jgi:uncharacterized Zn-binding protein involved in type VI secretion